MVVKLLDWDKHEIKMYAVTNYEKTKRIRSVDKEPETVAWLESLPQGTYFDVGANVGAYSLIADKLGHRVYSFEPHPPTFRRLQENIWLNESEVIAFNTLLDAENGCVVFEHSSEEIGSALHQIKREAMGEKTRAYRLDSFAHTYGLPQADYLKIDTDGAELDVLLGATEVLRGVRSILCEMDYDAFPQMELIAALLTDAGFHEESRHPHGTSTIENRIFSR